MDILEHTVFSLLIAPGRLFFQLTKKFEFFSFSPLLHTISLSLGAIIRGRAINTENSVFVKFSQDQNRTHDKSVRNTHVVSRIL